MKKRKSQPNLHSFLAKRSTHVGVGSASSDVQKDVGNVIVNDTNISKVADHVVESGTVNCATTENSSLESQEASKKIDHKDAVQLLNARKHFNDVGKDPLDDGMESIMHTEQATIITCIKIVYFCALEDIPLEKYQSHCRLLRELGTPNMPASEEYGSYMNAVSTRKMLLAIKHHVKMQLILDIRASPFHSLLIDKSIDRTIKKHLIIYALYVSKSPTKCAFVELLVVENANAKCTYDAISAFINENMLDIHKLIAIATDGAFVMIGHKTGVLSHFQESMPHIMGVHCIAHKQALGAKDGFATHPYIFAFVDKVANKIHSVRWLSRGQVMERLMNIIPLKRRYIDVDVQNFGQNSPYLSSFLKMAKDFMLFYEDARNKGSLDECVLIAMAYVKNILDGLTRRFEDLPVFNAFKNFSPSCYPIDAYDQEKISPEWLNRIINRLNIDTHMIDICKSMNEREDFVGMLYRVAKHKSMRDAWVVCNESSSWWDLYPEMMKIWQLCLVVPTSTSACERGFSRQNFIKSVSRSS
ncbi:hypothetical protein KP509_25G039500 [Ceratopteris richardii]|uniref:DUF4371 domain-containing protein n=1 Tax=Ceratopteris richardii TaxID=49495 RepID=A0A8T2RRF8_CERRI|nr:hypothetical protein KP509_25G039500 [Ceratopteris richardii]